MYYVLYDKALNALGTKKTYKCESWSLREKASEFDVLTITGAPTDNAENAMYVALHEDKGSIRKFALSGIPETKDGKITINAVDLRQLLNNEATIDLAQGFTTVAGLYTYLIGLLFEENKFLGNSTLGVSYAIDVTEVSGSAAPTWKSEALESSRAVGNVWTTLQLVNAVYNCFIETSMNFITKVLTFRVRQVIHEIEIKLADFEVGPIRSDHTTINRAVCVNDAYVEGIAGAAREVYYLLDDDTVYPEATVQADPDLLALVIYPANIKVIQEAEIADAVAKGIQELYKNRFQANVEINLETKLGYILADVDLTYQGKIKGFNSTDNSTYKALPVMERYQDSSGKKTVKFGRLEDSWWL